MIRMARFRLHHAIDGVQHRFPVIRAQNITALFASVWQLLAVKFPARRLERQHFGDALEQHHIVRIEVAQAVGLARARVTED